MVLIILISCNKPLFVSHLKLQDQRVLNRPTAGKHYFLSRVVCLNKRCIRVIDRQNDVSKLRFKGFKNAKPPKPYVRPEHDHEEDTAIIYASGRVDTVFIYQTDTLFLSSDCEKEKIIYVGLENGSTYSFRHAIFGVNSSKLSSYFKEELDAFGNFLKASDDLKVYIVGHTDSSGSKENNLKLSITRAASVVNYLNSMGISESRLNYDGVGSADPLMSNNTEEGRKQNRRITFELIKR